MNPLLNDEDIAKLLLRTDTSLLQSLVRQRMSEITVNVLLDSMGQQSSPHPNSQLLLDIQNLPNPISNSLHLMPHSLTSPASILTQKEHLVQNIVRNEQLIQEQQRKSAIRQIIDRRLNDLQSVSVSQSNQKLGKRSLEFSANPRKKARQSSIIDLTDETYQNKSKSRRKDSSVTGIAKLPCIKSLKQTAQPQSQKSANIHGKYETGTSSGYGPRSFVTKNSNQNE
jgi:hypothetical protein